jgi:hypothetical protein
MEKKIRTELVKMFAMMLVLVGLGIYARDFVWAGIEAKMALNLSIFGLFGLAAWLGFRHVFALKNEVIALKALQADYDPRGRRRGGAVDLTKPAVVFQNPELLGEGYRLITEELGKQNELQITNATVQSLVHEVDLRINDRKSTLIYFSGLMVFLGLLGAFMGLMKTVHSVSDLIGSMDMSGKGGPDAFGKMIEGMKAPLSGMSVGFSSSLFGLMTSMVLGALERCMTSAMKTLRNEFEHWVSKLAALESTSVDGAPVAGDDRALRRVVEAGTRQLQDLRNLAAGNAEAMRAEQARIDRLHATMTTMAHTMTGMTEAIAALADPGKVLAPITRAIDRLALHQADMLDRTRDLQADAAGDRENLRGLLRVLELAVDRLEAVDGPELHGQLDRLLAMQAQAAGLERDVAAVAGSSPEPARDGPPTWLRPLWSWWSWWSWAWQGQANRRIESHLQAQRREIAALRRDLTVALAGNRRSLRKAGRLVGRRLESMEHGRDRDRRQIERLAFLSDGQRAELAAVRARLHLLPMAAPQAEPAPPATGGRALLQVLRDRLQADFEAGGALRPADSAEGRATGTHD